MKALQLFSLIVMLFVLNACGGDSCQECTGTNANGETADFTVCENGVMGTTRTNNITGTSVDGPETYAASIAFFESAGLDCR